MYNLKIGTENFGEYYIYTNTFKYFLKKIFSQYNFTLEKSNKCDFIISAPFDSVKWNEDFKKPYIYWSGESYLPQIKSTENNYLEIYTTIENKDYLYIPHCLESAHIYKDRIDKNINRQLLLAYCHSNNVPEREQFYNLFIEKTSVKLCKAYGTSYGNYNDSYEPINDGHDFQGLELINKYKNHKFVMAFENKKKEGYITEKIINAFYSGAIPIYWGSYNIKDFFNEKAFINVSDFKNFNECIDYILNLTDKEREEIVNQPIYTNSNLINLINDDFNNKNENKLLDKYLEKIHNFFKNIYDLE